MLAPLILALATVQTQPVPPAPFTGPKLRAAVSGFDVKITAVSTTAQLPSGVIAEADIDIDKPGELGNGMADQLVTALIDSRKFIILERQDLDDISKEMDLQGKEAVQEDSTVQAGKLLGAQVLVRGAVTEMSYKRMMAGVGAPAGVAGDIITLGQGEFAATVVIDLKIVDVQTGQILDSVVGAGRVRNKSTYLSLDRADIGIGLGAFESSPLAKALREAIKDGVKKLSSRLEKAEWEARVVLVDANDASQIYLNFGADSGLKPGAELKVLRPGRVLIDPQTKLVLGREEGVEVGRLKLKTVNPKFSIGVVVSGQGFEPNDLVKYVSG